MRARLAGLVCLAVAGLIAYEGVFARFTTYRALAALPFLTATGLWLTAFGHPVGPDGLAPGWWRLGLTVLILAALVVTVVWSPVG